MLQQKKEDLVFENLLAKKEHQEDELWFQKGVTKTVEVIAFFGMFLVKNQTIYRLAVLLAGGALMYDFYLNYQDYRNQKTMERLLN